MKRIDFRIVIGVLLILASILGFLDKFEIIQSGWDLFWGVILGAAGIAFLYVFATNRQQWWAAIPGFTLLGMSASAFLLERLGWGGLAFLGGIGLGFWAVYLTGRERWWAIIPGGVLLTLGATSALSQAFRIQDTGSVFFIGLGLTFLLVAVLARQKWGYIPAIILIVAGALVDTAFEGSLDFVWIAALFLGGAALIWQYIRSK
jgi:hypothetical protein